MKISKKFLATAIIAPLSLLMTACEQKPPAAPVPLDEVRPKYSEDMQASLTAYFNAHSLTEDDITAGLTIPWVPAEKSKEYWGYLVATGELSEQNNPVFNAITFENVGETGRRFDRKLAMDPTP